MSHRSVSPGRSPDSEEVVMALRDSGAIPDEHEVMSVLHYNSVQDVQAGRTGGDWQDSSGARHNQNSQIVVVYDHATRRTKLVHSHQRGSHHSRTELSILMGHPSKP
ncbi:hypothetical protein DFP76_10751 [Marinomonas aquiplantarum]|uniref:Uncharacterized protein n=1 Tax=Marinomonas aquiplantarum TaxID=491951 RepID=A0A366CY43_9GAMM|nr:hypothetical protein DFP76_10751 [Marinomonas aquiplantarum]